MVLGRSGLAPLLARLADDLRLAPIQIALSLVFPITSFEVVPEISFQCDLELDRIVVVDVVTSLPQMALAIGLACAGLRVWARITSQLIGSIVWTIAMVPAVAVCFVLSMRLVQQPMRVLWRNLAPYTLGSIGIAGLVLGVSFRLDWHGIPMLVSFSLNLCLGAAAYAGVIYAVRPPALVDFLRVLSSFLNSPVSWNY